MKKILFISIYGHLSYSNAIKKALIKNDYVVYEPEYYIWTEVEENSNIQKKQNIKYVDAVLKNDIDWILVINHSYVDRSFFDICHKRNIKVFLYTMDSVRWCDYATDYLDDYTGIYSYEPTDCISGTLPAKIEYLPIGYDEDILYDEQLDKYEYDICFVGSLDKKRVEFLSCVADYAKENGKRMVVYTADQIKRFRSLKTIGKILSRRFRFKIKHRNLYNAIINTPIHGKDLRLLYNKTRICLNINQDAKNPEWHTGVNPRTFEIMGCNSFELIDEGHLDCVDIVNGRDIIEFSDKDDLIKKMDYYLSHDDERKFIAGNGCKLVKEKYTSGAIVKSLLRKIESMLQ